MTKKEAAELAAYKRSNKDRKKVLLERIGINRTNISRVLKGKYAQIKGYTFKRWVKDYPLVIRDFSKPNKVGIELILTNVTTGEITKHPSIRSVIKTGLSNTNILGKINTGIMIKKKKTKELFTLNTLDYGKKS